MTLSIYMAVIFAISLLLRAYWVLSGNFRLSMAAMQCSIIITMPLVLAVLVTEQF